MGLKATSATKMLYGTCNNCTAAGSCICGSYKLGHLDMLARDCTRSDGNIYVFAVNLRINFPI
eukprot:4362317-Pleurochrysis_carterae.AAC.2